MSRIELFEKLSEVKANRIEKEAKLEAFVQLWLEGKNNLSSNSIDQLIETTTKQLEKLKNTETELEYEYKNIVYQEELLKQSKQIVRNQLNASPDELIITNGILSTNASESHLIGKTKSPEQLEAERLQLLSNIKTKVLNREIILAEASKLSNDINIAYGFAIPTFNDEDSPKR